MYSYKYKLNFYVYNAYTLNYRKYKIMEALSTVMLGILSNSCFSLLQNSAKLLRKDIEDSILEGLKKTSIVLPDPQLVDSIAKEIETLEVSEDDSPKKIQKVMESNSELMAYLKKLETESTSKAGGLSVNKTVSINNSGSGNINFGNISQ